MINLPSVFEAGHIPTQKITLPSLEEKNIRLLIKRLDMVHPVISGNKFFKLKYNLQEAQRQGHRTILTFGGAYSNHIQATAQASRLAGLKAIGIIRGERPQQTNPTLTEAEDCGMLLHFITREQYRHKKEPGFLEKLKDEFGEFFLIPEGGTNALAIAGTKEILTGKDFEADIIACSVGTGGTVAGLIAAAQEQQEVWGFSALKGNFMAEEVDELLLKENVDSRCSYRIFTGYHFGGYAKHTAELVEFIATFNENLGIPLDPIYTGKMLFAVLEQCENLENKTILCIHTGGLQGIEGFNKRFGTDLKSR